MSPNAGVIRAPGLERPPALCRAPYLRQLESNDRKESALCCPPTWAQRRDHVPNLCSLDAGCTRIRYSADPIRHEGEKISERSEAWAGVSFANRASGQISHWIGHWKRGLQAQNAGIYGKKKWRRGWDCSRPGTAARPPLRSGPPQQGRGVQKSLCDFCRTRWVRPHILHRQMKRA